MKLYDCNFSEKAVKELQDYRDRQENIRLKLRLQHIETVKNRLRGKNIT